MRVLQVQWSWAFSHVCEVALILLAKFEDPPCLYRMNDMVVAVVVVTREATSPLFPIVLSLNININNMYIYIILQNSPNRVACQTFPSKINILQRKRIQLWG